MEGVGPGSTERTAAMLKNLQNAIKHTYSKITARRLLAIERWLITRIKWTRCLENDELQFLYNIFCDKNCWSDVKLNNTNLGQRLTKESIKGIKNPFSRYYMACRYCVEGKIKDLFQEELDLYKSDHFSDSSDSDFSDSWSADNDDSWIMRNELLDNMEINDPVFSFWIDRESEELKLKEYSNIDGFRGAIDLEWSEGAEYFYNRLSEQERKEEVTNAVVALSTINCSLDRAIVLDFCLHKMDDSTKRELLLKLSDPGVCSLLKGLIRWCFLDTIQDIVKRWYYDKASVLAGKTLPNCDELITSFPEVGNPELNAQVTSIVDILRSL